ncbi:hypothetical protein [Deinococcus deserti]|uniref:hypothetical protein n=1 Tax=Deinococcus deserti TaxID=310783 RepID=UPI00139239D8|nr:hypothetical protein [Deinococcus deserti]
MRVLFTCHWSGLLTAPGEDVYRKLMVHWDEPLRVAYHALHSAAYLGLERGITTPRCWER